MTTEIETKDITKDIMDGLPEEISKAVALNDLSRLSDAHKMQYYYAYCKSLGMDPLQKPFAFITFKEWDATARESVEREQLYATKNCGQQLAVRSKLNLVKVDEKVADGLMEVTYRASTEDGRQVDDVGVVSIKGLVGNNLANAKMKAHTKAMRRVTFAFLGLGILDESEIGTIKGATKSEPDFESETIVNEVPIVQDAEPVYAKSQQFAAPRQDISIPDVKCAMCGSDMTPRNGKDGKFLGCSNYPDCRNTMSIKQGQELAKQKEAELAEQKEAESPVQGSLA